MPTIFGSDLPPVVGPADLTPVLGPDSRMVQLGCVECFELGRGLVAQAGVASDGVVSVVPIGELDACVQDRVEGADVQELVALA